MSVLGENNGTQFTIPMAPAGMGGYGGMGGFGGDGWWGILFLIALMYGGWGGFGGMGGMGMLWPFLFGGFGNGFGGNGGSAAAQGALTREQACIDQNFNNLARTAEATNSAVNQGFANLNSTICHQEYETAQLINGVGNTVQQGFNAANVVALQNANAANVVALQNANAIQTQLADCCCKTQTGQMQLGYNMSTNTRDVIENQNANTRAILDKMCQQEIAAKDAQIAALNQQLFTAQLADSQSKQTAQIEARADARLVQVLNAINPPAVPTYPAPSPCGLGNWSPSVLANGWGNPCGNC